VVDTIRFCGVRSLAFCKRRTGGRVCTKAEDIQDESC